MFPAPPADTTKLPRATTALVRSLKAGDYLWEPTLREWHVITAIGEPEWTAVHLIRPTLSAHPLHTQIVHGQHAGAGTHRPAAWFIQPDEIISNRALETLRAPVTALFA